MIEERQAVRAILLTPESEVLLMRVHAPGKSEYFWITPGGGLEPGETSEDGLHRELREELGLEACVIGPLVWRRQHTFDWENLRICQCEEYHIVHVEHFEPKMSDKVEAEFLDQFRWWPISELAKTRERLTPHPLADIVEHYLADGAPQEALTIEMLVD